jgi:hypothetical protein
MVDSETTKKQKLNQSTIEVRHLPSFGVCESDFASEEKFKIPKIPFTRSLRFEAFEKRVMEEKPYKFVEEEEPGMNHVYHTKRIPVTNRGLHATSRMSRRERID